MSYTTYTKHCQAWICDDDRVPLHRCVGLVDLQVEWLENDACSFSASILNSSDDYDHLSDTADRFLYFMRRDQAQLFCIEYMQKTWILNEHTGRVEKATRISGRGANSFFLWTVDLQPDPSDADASGIAVTGNKDDAIKEFVRLSALVGTAYDDPATTARGIVGLTVAANKGDHPISVTDFARAGGLWNALIPLLADWDVEATLTPAWNGSASAITFEFDTHYQGRGSDKTADSADPVILADVYRVISESKWYRDTYGFITHGYTAGGRTMVVRGGVTNRIRRESRVDTQSTISVGLALSQYDIVSGHTIRFVENVAYQLGTGAAQLWIGDTFTHYNDSLETDAQDDRCTGFRLQYANDAVGSETIELILGDLEPQLPQNRGGGGFPGIIDPGPVKLWALIDDDGDRAEHLPAENAVGVVGDGEAITTNKVVASLGGITYDAIQIAGPWSIAAGEIYTVMANRDIVPNGGTGTLGQSDDYWDESFIEKMNVAAGNYVTMNGSDLFINGATAQSVDLGINGAVLFKANVSGFYSNNDGSVPSGLETRRWTNVYSIDGDFEGDVTIDTGGKGLIMSDVTAGYHLVSDGTRYVPTAPGAPVAHDILSAQHGDTVAAGVSRGSIIVGNATPKWEELTVGATSYHLESDGTDITWQHDLTLDATGKLIVGAAGRYIVTSGTGLLVNGVTGASVFLGINGATLYVANVSGYYPNDTLTRELGLSTRYWLKLWVDDIDLDGSITMDANETVDGVDVSAHMHGLAYTGTASGGASATGISGHGTSWDVAAYPTTTASNPVRDSGGTEVYLRTFASAADAANDVNPTGEKGYIGSTPHVHHASGSTGFGGIAATPLTVDAHTHPYDKTNTPTGAPS